MSNTYTTSLLTLPVEILYRIIDYLDTPTIFLSLSNVCTSLRSISSTYNRYQLNFTSISKGHFHGVCLLLQPRNILSLTLSDDNTTPGQIRLFLSLFNISEFSRLFSLTFLEIDDSDLSQVLHSNVASTLRSLVINWREAHCPTNDTMELLSSILTRRNLQKLELKVGSYTIEQMLWPVQPTLAHLTLMYITQKQYCTILRQTPNLRTLIINHCSMHKIDEDIATLPSSVFFEQLTSLVLTDSRMSMSGLTSILSLTPSLKYLEIVCSPDAFDTIADGFRWEQFIRMNLPLLDTLQFFFTNIYNVYYSSRDIQLLISRFQTPFWLEEKHWFVTCDYMNYLNQVMLYTTPFCSTDFTYECDANKISYSTRSTMNTDTIITDNVRTINLTLTKLITGAATTKNIKHNRYLFCNVTKLTIDVDEEWSSECIHYLSIILDLSCLNKLVLNPDLNPKSIYLTIENINILTGLANNLTTLGIHSYSSSDSVVLMEHICAIIPHHIRYLEVTIRDIDTMKMILDHHHQHLWSLTLLAFSDRSIPWSEFIDELIKQNKDFVHWESYYSLRIWFG